MHSGEYEDPAGSIQRWDPEVYRRTAGFIPELAGEVLDLLAPRCGERVLDLGCGDGALTAKLAALGLDVVGVDSSAEQVTAARARGLDAHVVDGQALNFDADFDAVFSNAALHWMLQVDEVITRVWRALRPGGRFVAEMGGAGNIETVVRALDSALERREFDGAAMNPWYFPSDVDYRARLERAGFTVAVAGLFQRPTPLPGSIEDWLELFAQSFLAPIPPTDRPVFLAEVAEELRPQLQGEDGIWRVDYVRLRFHAVKPQGR